MCSSQRKSCLEHHGTVLTNIPGWHTQVKRLGCPTHCHSLEK